MLRVSSDSPSVGPALDSGLRNQALLRRSSLDPPGEEGRRGTTAGPRSASRVGEVVLEKWFCSEECEDRDSMLPMGVLPGLLLRVSPIQGPENGRPEAH